MLAAEDAGADTWREGFVPITIRSDHSAAKSGRPSPKPHGPATAASSSAAGSTSVWAGQFVVGRSQIKLAQCQLRSASDLEREVRRRNSAKAQRTDAEADAERVTSHGGRCCGVTGCADRTATDGITSPQPYEHSRRTIEGLRSSSDSRPPQLQTLNWRENASGIRVQQSTVREYPGCLLPASCSCHRAARC